MAAAFADEDAAVPLVESGRAVAEIIEDVPAGAGKREVAGIRKAAELLRFAVRRSTGVELPASPGGGALPDDRPVVLIGGGPLTEALGFRQSELKSEEFRVVTKGPVVALYGSGTEDSTRGGRILTYCATSYWAVAEVISRQWGGLWLWPGPSGFSIPARKSLAIRPVEGVLLPALVSRGFGMTALATPARETDAEVWARVVEETGDWLRFHGIGSRGGYRSPHSFADWMDKYGATKPELFARPPAGQSLPDNKAERAKLRTSNPEVVRTIVAEWEAAGRPPEWGVGPNDGAFFCTAPETLALDDPPNQDPVAVWNGSGNLSARYARFYQDISRAMKEAGGGVTLQGLAYGSYREAPRNPEAFAMQTPVILGFIHNFDEHAKSQWLGWQKTGAELFLRPNWLHSGASAPNLRTPEMVEWLEWSTRNGSRAFHFDSILGYWGTQGFNYYAIARAGQDPTLPFDKILDEYCSGFGKAAGPVKRYLEYWIGYSKEAGFPIAAGGPLPTNPGGLYAKAVAEHRIPDNPVAGSHSASIFLYPDKVVNPAREILNEAERKADTGEDRERVAFLRDGLDHLVLTRDTGLAGLAAAKNPSPETTARYNELSKELKARRTSLTPRHVVWGDSLNGLEKRARSPVADPKKSYNPESDRGM